VVLVREGQEVFSMEPFGEPNDQLNECKLDLKKIARRGDKFAILMKDGGGEEQLQADIKVSMKGHLGVEEILLPKECNFNQVVDNQVSIEHDSEIS